ncbi:MAG: undecaprenyldiphospho-muramoylpentapeptide beta-N-acetylglucosaminyltransferase [Desulfobacterales bacterium]|nr:undecaprenyldiphospho-muramoylpentapeptide beta-N-acetylglucosaminyltransferase [Desulfobacterales bacterium]
MSLRIIIAGGGTGGHLFPGIAIANELIKKNKKNKILFVTSGKDIDKNILYEHGFKSVKLTIEGIKGKKIVSKIRSGLKIPKAIIESFIILKKFKPDIVIGVGGYSSGPIILMAYFLGIKTAIQEQNSIPGITNKILSLFVDRIYISFKDYKNIFNPSKTLLTGNPVRNSILNSINEIKKDDSSRFSILVMGGSQGAHAINMAVIESLNFIRDSQKFFFIHQSGQRDELTVKKSYDRLNFFADVKPFFKDMKSAYNQADLLICRAGATTISEITVLGKPAIFIPFPFAADNHQFYNALEFLQKGACKIILEEDLSGKLIAEIIEYYCVNREKLKIMASKAKEFAFPNSANDIVNDCYKLVGL